MAEKTMKVSHFICRNDVAINWRVKNPVLKKGEMGIETDTSLMKIGDGVSTWNNLEYVGVTALTTDEIDDLFENA